MCDRYCIFKCTLLIYMYFFFTVAYYKMIYLNYASKFLIIPFRIFQNALASAEMSASHVIKLETSPDLDVTDNLTYAIALYDNVTSLEVSYTLNR